MASSPTQRSHHRHGPHSESDGHQHGLLGKYAELTFALAAAVCLGLGWSLSLVHSISPWWLYVTAYGFGSWFMVQEAIGELIVGRFEIDFLMLVAAVGAALLGAWAEGALLLVLFSLGHALEHYAMGRATGAIQALAELAPSTAIVKRGGTTAEVSVNDLRVGDIVVVKPNARIAADGFVIEGTSSVNQAPITGESVPVDKEPVPDAGQASRKPSSLAAQHRVFAGTVNGSGTLEIQVTKLASDNTLARVVQMVAEAETRISPTQQLTKHIQLYYVPIVLGLVVLLHFAWLVVDEPFSASFYRAMAVLVAASPCALAIATPSATLSGIARAARGGVLIKGGGPLESLGKVPAIAFDKTGTLTTGNPKLTDVLTADSIAEEELLRVAIAVESLSDHPLASALVRDGQQRLGQVISAEAENLRSVTGRGVQADFEGQSIAIGKRALFSEIPGPSIPPELDAAIARLETGGRTTMVVRAGQRYLGVLGLMDTPRQSAKQTIACLRKLGVQQMLMLSGDNQSVADAVAQEIGIDEAFGDLMPEDKVDAIRKLQSSGGVAMVGDGVNDAPAMANAAVGIAMGAAGSDVALEAADIALMSDDLSHLPFAVGLSRQTSRIVRQNLWFSMGMVVFLVPAAILGLDMGPAVALHEGSTVAVVINALRLLAYPSVDP